MSSTSFRTLTGSRLLMDGAWALGGKGLGVILAVATNALLARLLPPDLFGAFFVIASVTSLLAMVAQAGLAPAVVRLIAEAMGRNRPDTARAVTTTVVILGLLGAILVATIFALGLGHWLATTVFRSPAMTGVVAFAAIWIIPLTLQSIQGEIFRGFHDIRAATLFGGLLAGALTTLFLAALWLRKSDVGLAEMVLLATVACALSVLMGKMVLYGRLRQLPTDGTAAAMDTLQVAAPMLVTHVMGFAMTQADLWVIGIFRSFDEVSIYGAAAKIAIIVVIPLWVLNSIIAPVIAQYFVQGRKGELERLLRRTATWAGFVAMAITVVFVAWGDQILGLLFGPFYRAGATVLVILSLGQFVNVLTGPCGTALVMTGHQRVVMWISIISGTALVVTAVAIAPAYGVVGIAAAVAVVSALHNVIMLIATRKLVGIWTHFSVTG